MESREILKANLGILMKQFPHLGSQSEVAGRARVSRLTMEKILAGGTAVTTDTLDKIAAAFSLKAWHLLNPEMEVSEKELRFYEELIQKLDVLKRYE